MVRRFCSVLVALLVGSVGAQATPLEGVFNTGRSEVDLEESGTLDVQFYPCEDDAALSCGTIVQVLNPKPGEPQVMPDGSPMVGFTMITGLEHKGDGKYRGGKINAVDQSLENGKMYWYDVKIDVLEDGRLKLKGCKGFICPRTLYWAPTENTSALSLDPSDAPADTEVQ